MAKLPNDHQPILRRADEQGHGRRTIPQSVLNIQRVARHEPPARIADDMGTTSVQSAGTCRRIPHPRSGSTPLVGSGALPVDVRSRPNAVAAAAAGWPRDRDPPGGISLGAPVAVPAARLALARTGNAAAAGGPPSRTSRRRWHNHYRRRRRAPIPGRVPQIRARPPGCRRPPRPRDRSDHWICASSLRTPT